MTVKCEIVNAHNMREQRASTSIAASLTSALECDWSTSCPDHYAPFQRKSSLCSLNRRLDGPQSQSAQFWRRDKSLASAGTQFRIIKLVVLSLFYSGFLITFVSKSIIHFNINSVFVLVTYGFMS